MSLTLSSATFEAFAVQVRASWAERTALQLHSTYPDYFTALDVTSEDLAPLCQQVERFAARHEVTGEREVFRLILVAISMGHRFWQDPRFHGYVVNSLGNVDIVPSRRALAMVDNGKIWLRLLWNNDDLGAFAGRLTKHLRRNAISGPDAIQSILPRH